MRSTDIFTTQLSDRMLIIHADDFGMCHSVNEGTIFSINKGCANSVSIMPPCAAFMEAVYFAKQRPDLDCGVHLTLTSEWPGHRWRPVSPVEKVWSLVDQDRFFYKNADQLVEHALSEHLETEMRAQIDSVISQGVILSHIDCHMLSCCENEIMLNAYTKIGKMYKLPCLISKQFMQYRQPHLKPEIFVGYGSVLPELAMAVLPDMRKEAGNLATCYEEMIRNLPVGLSVILIHPGIDDAELRSVTGDEIEYGASWRQEDTDFFTSDQCRKILKEENIMLVTWRQAVALFSQPV